MARHYSRFDVSVAHGQAEQLLLVWPPDELRRYSRYITTKNILRYDVLGSEFSPVGSPREGGLEPGGLAR